MIIMRRKQERNGIKEIKSKRRQEEMNNSTMKMIDKQGEAIITNIKSRIAIIPNQTDFTFLQKLILFDRMSFDNHYNYYQDITE